MHLNRRIGEHLSLHLPLANESSIVLVVKGGSHFERHWECQSESFINSYVKWSTPSPDGQEHELIILRISFSGDVRG